MTYPERGAAVVTDTKDVFISYHMKSASEIVKQIAAALESVGITCWYAERDLPLGTTWTEDIPKAIHACKILLFILDEKSNRSEHVQNELHLAFQRISKHESVKIVTFKVDDCTLSDGVAYFTSRFQTINGKPPDKERIQNLIEQLTVIIKGSPTWAMVGELKNRISELEYEQIQQTRMLQKRKQALEQAQTEIRELQQERARQIQELEQKQTQQSVELEQAQMQIQELKQNSSLQALERTERKMHMLLQYREKQIHTLEQQLQQEQQLNKKQKTPWRMLLRFFAMLFILSVLIDLYIPPAIIALILLILRL